MALINEQQRQKLIYKYDRFFQALSTLHTSLNDYHNLDKIIDPSHPRFYDLSQALRDSVIKRFEFSLDLFWKYLRLYLELKHGVTAGGPKDVARQCVDIGVLSPEHGEQILAMIEDRNQTSHIYREEIADIIAKHIDDYAVIMDDVMQLCRLS